MRAFGWIVLVPIAFIVLSVHGFFLGWFRPRRLVGEQVDPYARQQNTNGPGRRRSPDAK